MNKVNEPSKFIPLIGISGTPEDGISVDDPNPLDMPDPRSLREILKEAGEFAVLVEKYVRY